jgi:hypothetical protein
MTILLHSFSRKAAKLVKSCSELQKLTAWPHAKAQSTQRTAELIILTQSP